MAKILIATQRKVKQVYMRCEADKKMWEEDMFEYRNAN